MLKIDENTDIAILQEAILLFETSREQAIGKHGTRGWNQRNVSWIVSLGQGNPMNLNFIYSQLELDLRAGIKRLNADPTVSNVRRYEKASWGTNVLFERKGQTYMMSEYDRDNDKFCIYIHNANEYALNKSNLKIK